LRASLDYLPAKGAREVAYLHGDVNISEVGETGEISYRAIELVLDFIHRLVCGRQKIPQRFGDWICLRSQVDGAG
jgi:hypothetical protein